jgi:predicted glycosyltransferase
LTFAGAVLELAEPAELGSPHGGLVRVPVRPPAEESHYYRERSRALYLAALRHPAAREEVAIVLAPRYARQRDDIRYARRGGEPADRARAPSLRVLSLLRAVDLVLCSGGTMLREAAYLGIPAYSLFASELGAVDRHLAETGRAVLISSPEELSQIRLTQTPSFSPLSSNPTLADELAALLLDAP